jgi:hypothetical protein
MSENYDGFRVTLGSHWLSRLVHRYPSIWKRLGSWETASVAQQIADVEVTRPVFVAGLARSGSTVLLEFLARHPQVATHRYSDFPVGLFLPTLWNRGRRSRRYAPRERAHGDRLQVTPDSPEAMEEVLWMAFFSGLHDSSRSSVCTAGDRCPEFETFYRDHIRKLLHVRGRTRYVSKGNYNICRLQYLRAIFPDARFVVPIRHPLTHVASLMRQHRRFSEGQRRHRRALDHVRRVGHFEFGLDRRPMNLGDSRTVDEVLRLWESGEETRGWARYWAYVYGWLHELLAADPPLADASLIVRYEDLCRRPLRSLEDVLQHCFLDDSRLAEEFAGEVSAPDYYRPDFSENDLAVLEEETGEVARRYGYEGGCRLDDSRDPARGLALSPAC